MEFAKTISDKELKNIEMRSRKQLADYFMNQMDREIAEIRKMVEEYSGSADTLQEKLAPYGLVRREYSFGGFMTWPDVWDICYFEKQSVDLKVHENNFFSAPADIGEYSFVDLGFSDKDGRIFAKSCLHEYMLDMDLTDKQLAELERIGISYARQ